MDSDGHNNYKGICAEIQWMPSNAFMALWQSLEVPYIIEARENYQKRSWRNRAYILNAQGRQLLSIPLDSGKNAQMPIQDVTINYNEDWPRQHLRTIMAAYGSAPFYEHYLPEIEQLYTTKPKTLWDWNLQWLKWFRQKLYLDLSFSFTDEFEKEKELNILDIRNFNANRKMISDLRMNSDFWYPQIFEAEIGTHPNVSVIDLLFCTGPEAGTYLSRYWKKVKHHE